MSTNGKEVWAYGGPVTISIAGNEVGHIINGRVSIVEHTRDTGEPGRTWSITGALEYDSKDINAILQSDYVDVTVNDDGKTITGKSIITNQHIDSRGLYDLKIKGTGPLFVNGKSWNEWFEE